MALETKTHLQIFVLVNSTQLPAVGFEPTQRHNGHFEDERSSSYVIKLPGWITPLYRLSPRTGFTLVGYLGIEPRLCLVRASGL